MAGNMVLTAIKEYLLRRSKIDRPIKNWANIYDVVNFFVFFIFGGRGMLQRDIVRMAEIKPKSVVLDVGCGTGRFLDYLVMERDVSYGIGVDVSPNMINIAQKREVKYLLEFQTASAANLPFLNEKFDYVFCVFLLHHLTLNSKLDCLREACRVLKKNGVLILVDIDKPSSFLGRLIGLSRVYIPQIRENMEGLLSMLMEVPKVNLAGFSEIKVVRKDYGIFSFIRCVK